MVAKIVSISVILIANISWGYRECNHDANTGIRVLLECCASRVDIEYLTGVVEIRSHSMTVHSDFRGSFRVEWQAVGKALIGDISVHTPTITITPRVNLATFRYKGTTYRGQLRLLLGRKGIAVINLLPLEEYLIGTLSGEMNGSWELEALKAQAVASRSFAAHMILNPRHGEFDIVASTLDQVYVGGGIENWKIVRAVRETTSKMLWVDNKPLKAYFHSRCGGATRIASDVWGRGDPAFRRSVACEFCRADRKLWQTQVSRDELLAAFGFPVLRPRTLRLETVRNDTGHIGFVSMFVDSSRKTLAADTFRARLGYSRIKSAQFDFSDNADGFTFAGKGHGHGVGMCQWGVRHLARKGKRFDEILVYYYPDAELK